MTVCAERFECAEAHRVDVALEHELDVVAGYAHARGEQVHDEGAPLAEGSEVRRNVRLPVRLADVGCAHGGVGVLGVDAAPRRRARSHAHGVVAKAGARRIHADARQLGQIDPPFQRVAIASTGGIVHPTPPLLIHVAVPLGSREHWFWPGLDGLSRIGT